MIYAAAYVILLVLAVCFISVGTLASIRANDARATGCAVLAMACYAVAQLLRMIHPV